jgi:hypothetical protein
MDTKVFSKKPKLSTFSEKIFSIGDNGEIKLGGEVLPFYKCTLHSTYCGLGYQLRYDGIYMGGYHLNEIDVFTTINNHERYLEELESIECEIMELENNINELESQLYNDNDVYLNLVGGEIDIEDLESNIFELNYLLEIEQNELSNLKKQSISDWNC